MMRLRTNAAAGAVLACLCGGLLLPAARGQSPRYAGTRDLLVRHDTQPPLRMPSDVAVDSGGRIFVADGVGDRVLVFEPDGELSETIEHLAGAPLRRPYGLAMTADDTLWIADAGNRRIVSRPGGGVSRALPVEADLTDVLAAPDGRLWVTDNDGHRIGWLRDDAAAPTWIGDAIRYPTMLARTPVGDLLVSEALAGRVRRLTTDGRPAGTIGVYGVDLGQFYRARGIAVAADSTIWIADATLGVVQVFSETGAFIDVLRDRSGDPLRFASPTGLAFAPDGSLVVAELAADQVVRVALEVNPAAATGTPGPRRDGSQPTNCTACHLEWMAPLADGVATPLADPPEDTPAHPAASRSAACLSCHDGSVVDSRNSVWFGHGHARGVPLAHPEDVPEAFPLVNGGIACRTCHSAHTRGGAGETIANAVFLRVENHAGELCLACHADYDAGTGSHPLPVLESAAQTLVDSHGLTAEGGLTCLACHQGHGGAAQLLRGAGSGTNAQCLACHGDHGRQGHPVTADLTSEQADWVASVGGTVGVGGQLVCSSCHQMHAGHGGQRLLRAEPGDAASCRGCHADQTELFGTSHDLAASHPSWEPIGGTTVAAGGTCSACHATHSTLSGPTSTLDATGACLRCHSAGGIGAAHVLGDRNHPETDCLACHDPHSNRHAGFLRDTPTQLCRDCHVEIGALAGGGHDREHGGGVWPSASAAAHGACLACHLPHGDETRGLFTAGLGAGAEGDRACLACHEDSAWDGGGHAVLHPRTPADYARAHGLATDGDLRCVDCHDPHLGRRVTPAMLRGPDDDPLGTASCLTCHAEVNTIRHIGHDPGRLAQAGLDVVGCAPCHQTHAGGDARFAVAASADTASQCRQCHQAGGPGQVPVVADHPEMALVAAPGVAEDLPLDGGRIVCGTCHLPHGRDVLAGLDVSDAVRRAADGHLRAFRAPNVCTQCHGFDGLRRFLYFHDPVRRKGAGTFERGPTLWRPRAGGPG